jgi:6-phosphogluconolactonase
MNNIRVYTDSDLLKRAAAEHFVSLCEAAINKQGHFSVALSGGSTPKRVYELLADQAFSPYVDWDRVHIFWGDERCVPPDHSDSNYRMTRLALLEHIRLPVANIHRIQGELDPAQAADNYEQTLRQFFANRGGHVRFDLVLLGMGDDGHTASLFPGTAALDETERSVVANYVDKLNAWRITLTASAINNAANITFLISGKSKAESLQQVLEGPHQPYHLPSQLIQPVNGSLLWMLDAPAASLLAKPAPPDGE